jgi:hypothetical protein
VLKIKCVVPDLEEKMKRKMSYLGRVPSVDFWDEAYQLFLEFASPEELDEDILTRETLEKINKALGFD